MHFHKTNAEKTTLRKTFTRSPRKRCRAKARALRGVQRRSVSKGNQHLRVWGKLDLLVSSTVGNEEMDRQFELLSGVYGGINMPQRSRGVQVVEAASSPKKRGPRTSAAPSLVSTTADRNWGQTALLLPVWL